MKNLLIVGLSLSIAGICIFGCNKGEDKLTLTYVNSNENLLKTVRLPGQFTFDSGQLSAIENDLELFAKALCYISDNELILQKIFNSVVLPEHDEEISIEELEVLLTSNSIDLWTLLASALNELHFSPSEISSVHGVYKSFIMNNKAYKTFIFIPFTDSVDFSNQPYVTSQIDEILSISDLNIYSRNLSGGIQLEQINRNQARNSPLLFISIASVDGIEYAALPWSWCECTRDSQWEDGNGQIHTSTLGTCINRGACGRCGRSDFRGNCKGGSCPGC